MVGKINENSSETYGFDAQTEQFVDLIQAGIIDPAKVVRAALQDAASVAGLLITTEAMVAEAPKKETAPPCRAAAAWAGWTINPGPGSSIFPKPEGPGAIRGLFGHSSSLGSGGGGEDPRRGAMPT